MAANCFKQVRYVAVGYGIFAAMFAVIIGMLINVAGWHGMDQLFADLKLMGNTPYILVGAFSLNFALAIGAWYIFSFQRIARNIIVGAAIVIATLLVINNLWTALLWVLRSGVPSTLDISVPFIAHLFLTFAYAYLAFMLTWAVAISNPSINADATR